MSLFGHSSHSNSLFGSSEKKVSPPHPFDWKAAALSFMGVDPNIFIGRRRQQAAQAAEMQVRAGLKARGYSDSDIDVLMADPKAASALMAQVLQPRQFSSSGGSVDTPGLNGQPHNFTMAPSRHEFQGSVFDVGGGPAGQQAPVTPQHEGTQWVTPQAGTTAFGVNSFSGARRSGGGSPMESPPQNMDATPTIEDGHAYRPGPGGRANPANWIPLAQGGAGRSGPPTFPDPMKAPGHMTSGRRTIEGNRRVGGVPNSHHLDGDAADYVGTNMDALRNYFGPDARYLNEGDHLHVTLPGYHRVPFFGANGTYGLRGQ